ncbi:MAG: hypothetical protein ACK47C_20435 [Paracoccaceae bacterium]
MTGPLIADCLISLLAALALLGLRVRLRQTAISPRLRTTLRFATLIWSLLYLLRIPAWLTDSVFAGRIVLVAASLIPLSLLLVTEAAMRRHAPARVKYGLLVLTPAFVGGALFLPASAFPQYLPALLAFQLVALVEGALMLWRVPPGHGSEERRVLRLFAGIVVVALPLVITDFAFIGAHLPIRLSALAMLAGTWLAIASSTWVTTPGRAVLGLAGFVALSLAGGAALGLASGPLTFDSLLVPTATILAILFFVAATAGVIRLSRGEVADQLVALLAQPHSAFTLEAIMTTLAPYNPRLMTRSDLAETDLPRLALLLAPRPAWPLPGDQIDPDRSDELGDIARANGCSHLLALRTDPPEVLALTLSAPQSNTRIGSLLCAIALRYQAGGQT